MLSVDTNTQDIAKIRPGFHHELLHNKFAASWLEESMCSDLAKYHLFQLNEELLRLHKKCANFSPNVIKHDRLNDSMTVNQSAHNATVSNAVAFVKNKRRNVDDADVDETPSSFFPPQFHPISHKYPFTPTIVL